MDDYYEPTLKPSENNQVKPIHQEDRAANDETKDAQPDISAMTDELINFAQQALLDLQMRGSTNNSVLLLDEIPPEKTPDLREKLKRNRSNRSSESRKRRKTMGKKRNEGKALNPHKLRPLPSFGNT